MIYRDISRRAMCGAQEHRWWAIILYSILDGGNICTYHCTLYEGHSGDHMAEGYQKYPICHQWPQKKTKALLPAHVMPHEWNHPSEEPPVKTRIAGWFPYYRVYVKENEVEPKSLLPARR